MPRKGTGAAFVAMVGFCFLPLEGLGFPRCRVSEIAAFVAGIAFKTVGLFVPYHFNYMSKTQEIYGIAAKEVKMMPPGGKDFFAGRGDGYGELWRYLRNG